VLSLAPHFGEVVLVLWSGGALAVDRGAYGIALLALEMATAIFIELWKAVGLQALSAAVSCQRLRFLADGPATAVRPCTIRRALQAVWLAQTLDMLRHCLPPWPLISQAPPLR
jgi:hypothetical protein